MICLTMQVPELTSVNLPWPAAADLDTSAAARILERLAEIHDKEIAALQKAGRRR